MRAEDTGRMRKKICVGEYSDDTQLIIATARSLLRGRQWSNFFSPSRIAGMVEV